MGVTRHVRAARWAGAVLVGLAPLPLLVVAASAEESSFTAMTASAPGGNKGTLKVHEEGTPSGTVNNDPKVCVFNLEGFFFETGQTGYVLIEPQGGNGGPSPVGPVDWGPADGSGFAATEYFNSPAGLEVLNGQYKATLYGKMLPTGQLDDAKAKSKVFKVICEDQTTPPTTTTGTTTTTTKTTTTTTTTATSTQSTSSAPGVKPTKTKTTSTETTNTKKPTVLPTRSTSQPAVLPQTGSGFPTGGALAASLLLMGLGALLILGPGRAVPIKPNRRH